MEHFLIAIIPSEDIVIQIRKTRTSLFKKFGIISSRCLPEIIPVAFIDEILNKNQFKGLTFGEVFNSTFFSTTINNSIFLKTNNVKSINLIKERISENIIPGLFPTNEGFYLGTIEEGSNIKEIIRYLNYENNISLKWGKNNLELIKITTGNTNWWEEIHWESIWKLKINLS